MIKGEKRLFWSVINSPIVISLYHLSNKHTIHQRSLGYFFIKAIIIEIEGEQNTRSLVRIGTVKCTIYITWRTTFYEK